jgi:hypothetical protein
MTLSGSPFAVRHFNQEFDLLMVGSVVIFDFAGNGSAKLPSIGHVADEGEAEKFIWAKV